MSKWKYKIDLIPKWEQCLNGDIGIKDLSDFVIEKLEALPCFDSDSELQDIAFEFSCVEDSEDFDGAMDMLYNWGDQEVPPYGKFIPNKMAWIATFF